LGGQGQPRFQQEDKVWFSASGMLPLPWQQSASSTGQCALLWLCFFVAQFKNGSATKTEANIKLVLPYQNNNEGGGFAWNWGKYQQGDPRAQFAITALCASVYVRQVAKWILGYGTSLKDW
jgi:hypothetical protein